MKKYSIVILFLATSCMQDYSKIVFTHYLSDVNRQKKIKYSADIPKGFTLKTYKAGGESGIENQYKYSDSSLLYITDFGRSLNEQNIDSEGYASTKFKYIMKTVSLINDTLILSGKNKNGFYWKEILFGKIIIGYLNVSLEKKSSFDKALNTFKSY
jgi:hypothetical protein